MKRKLALLLALSTISTVSFADIHLILPASLGPNACANLPGTWNGEGKVSSTILNCHYNAKNTRITQSDPEHFLVHLDLKPDSPGCVGAVADLQAHCKDNVIDIMTASVTLNGSINGNTIAFKDGAINTGVFHAKIDYINLMKV